MYKIISLQLINHPILKDISINFTDKDEYYSSKYVSLIIGSNGTGKTQILRALLDILISINDNIIDKKNKWIDLYDFKLTLFQNEIIYLIESSNGKIQCNKIDLDFKENFLPTRILVSAYTFDDKFQKAKESEFYRYLGLKTTTNNIFLKNPSIDTFESIRKIILSDGQHLDLLDKVFKELKFQKRIKVKYEKRRNYKILFDKKFIAVISGIINQPEESIIEDKYIEYAIEVIEIITKINDPHRIKRIKDDAIRRLINNKADLILLLKYLSRNFNLNDKENPIKLEFSYCWDIDNYDSDLNSEFVSHSKIFNLLSDLDILSFDSFLIHRKDFFDFRNTSSGEFHFLHLASNIISNIEDNSLIVIDEPEISLHVNWQNKFFYLINPIIEKFKNCHFIIASHSHLLVSELDPKISAIITLKKDDKDNIVVTNLKEKGINPSGWSAEQILFEVFEVVTDRNFYLYSIVEKMIREMEKNKPDYELIDIHRKELRCYDYTNLNDNDPMKLIIKNLLTDELGSKK